MQPEYFNKLAAIVSGLTAFLVKEDDLRLFFRNRTNDLVEMAAAVANLGCEMVIIHLSDGNKMLYELTTRKKWLIPMYPSARINYHSAQASFGGGLLAGYRLSFEPLQALKYGIITESIAAEGLHPLNMFDSLPGLAKARINALDEMVRPI
jgi:sugar/nucleoside kinase (ribokinase family)